VSLDDLVRAAQRDRAPEGAKRRVAQALAARVAAGAAVTSPGERSTAVAPAKGGAASIPLGKAIGGALATGALGLVLGLGAGPTAPGRASRDLSASAGEITLAAAASFEAAAPVAAADDSTPRGPDGHSPVDPPNFPAPARASDKHAPPRAANSQSAQAAAPPGAGGSGSIAEETALLRDVQGALRDGDAARAARWLGELDARFPGGALAEERASARVLVLCAEGRAAEAREEADRFGARYPGSVHAARLRGSCAGP
jgi:hypothetical protein